MPDNLEHLHQLGQFIGRIHAVGASYPSVLVALRVADFGRSVAPLEKDFIPVDLRAAYQSITEHYSQQLMALAR